MRTVRFLTEAVGERPAGSERERAAARHVAEECAEAGATVVVEPVVFRAWRPGDKGRIVVAGLAEPLEGVPFPYTMATASSAVEGLLRDEGEWPVLPGRVTCRRYVLYEEASERPLAAVLVSPFPEPRPMPNIHPLSALPTLVVGEREAQLLAAAVAGCDAGRLSASIAVPAAWEGQAHSQNVVAEIGPKGPRFLVVSHLDSVVGSPGANDNAAGVATALEVLRCTAQADLPVGLRFLFCGAEEPFLVGSRAHATGMLADATALDTIGCLNLDMVAIGDEFVLRAPDDAVWRAIVARSIADPPTPIPLSMAPTVPASDHWAFHEIGIPSAQLTRVSDVLWHAPDDAGSRIRQQALDEAAATALALLRHYMAVHTEQTERMCA